MCVTTTSTKRPLLLPPPSSSVNEEASKKQKVTSLPPPPPNADHDELIGSGTFGKVYGSKRDGRYVTKVVQLFKADSMMCANIRELLMYTCCCRPDGSIPGVVRNTDVRMVGDDALITLRRGIDLGVWTRSKTFRERVALLPSLVEKLVAALREFHAEGYRHWDLKEANIVLFLSEDGTELDDVRLCDLGTAMHGDAGLCVAVAECCTPGYRAPETFAPGFPEAFYGNHNDLYGLGCIIHYVIYKQHYDFKRGSSSSSSSSSSSMPRCKDVPSRVDAVMRALLNDDAQTRAGLLLRLRPAAPADEFPASPPASPPMLDESSSSDRVVSVMTGMIRPPPDVHNNTRQALMAQTIKLVDMFEKGLVKMLAKPIEIKACYLLAETIILPGGILVLNGNNNMRREVQRVLESLLETHRRRC